MISSYDTQYQVAKMVKQGKKTLSYPFTVLKEWIDNEFNVNVLCFYYDHIQSKKGSAPRLDVILEWDKDVQPFMSDDFRYNQAKQLLIATKFSELVNNQWKLRFRYKTKNTFVIFSSFERIAIEETNNKITPLEINELKKQLGNETLWEISRFFSSVTIFFYKDEQIKLNIENGFVEQLKKAYLNLITKYDEFGYIKHGKITFNTDSKENFDQNYQSNWYYYYK